MIKVSVIVPVYNVKNYLSKCLDSLVNQSLQDIEIIVINDGSTDNSLKIINDFSNRFPSKIKIINQDNNGIGQTRNNGIDIANGKYLAFVDGDDYVDLKMIENSFIFAERYNLDIVVCDYYQCNVSYKEKKFIKDFKISNIQENPELLFKINNAPWAKLFKKELFNNYRFPINLKYEDLGVIPIILGEAKKIGKLNGYYYYYIIRKKSQSSIFDEKVFDIFKILDIVNSYFRAMGSHIEAALEYLNIKHIVLYIYLQNYQKDKSLLPAYKVQAQLYLNTNFPNWKKNIFYKNERFLKKFIKKNKHLAFLYYKCKEIFFKLKERLI